MDAELESQITRYLDTSHRAARANRRGLSLPMLDRPGRMTTETRTYVEASDLLAVEFECAHCSASTAIPMQVFREPPIRCHACERNRQWLIPGAEEFLRIVRVIEGLRLLAEPHANGDQRFRLKFQLREVKLSS